MEIKMTEGQMLPKNAAARLDGSDGKAKKKASWSRTILWMVSMALLGNVIMGIIAYFLFFANK